MKTKLQLLFALLLSVTSLQAQNTDVWDFGATQLTGANNNLLNATVINGWYPGTVVPGTAGVNFPVSFTVGALTWVGNAGDRLRTTNTALSRFDANVASVTTYTGRVYCNGTPNLVSGVPTNRFMRMVLNEDDEVTIVTRGDAASNLNFVYEANPATQTNVFALPFASGVVSNAVFVAKNAGSYKIYSADGKPSFFRILRKAAVYTAVSGSIDLSQAAGIPSNYAVVFTNAAGKSWTATMNMDGTYNANLPIGYTYTISLVNANGYIITNGTTLDLTTVVTPTFTRNISILQATLYQVTGAITGLGTSISSLALSYVADPASNTVYVPVPVINTANATYTVQLQDNVPYTIVAQGVNDYQMVTNTITIPPSNTTSDIAFTAKPTYPVSINTIGLTPTQLSNLHLTFTNLNESGYVYNFNDISTVSLRNGTYSVIATGLDSYPVQLALTSNLTVNGSAVSKTLTFVPVTVWSFDDKVITASTPAYKGMLFTGNISNSIGQGHLIGQPGGTIQVPVNPGEKIRIEYYYAANFSIEGGATITTVNSTNTTSITDYVEYTYAGVTSGFVNIAVAGTSYFTEIKIGGSIPYQALITVGADKDYQTINAALTAVSNMTRTSTQRVTIAIDPGNYEEMLTVNQANVTLKNAATTPNTNLTNAGVGIAPGAVRVTSYYGHGYNYYSMSSDQKWHQDVLNVNIANGYASYQNAGAGTTNNSYWNATVVVGADGFEAEGIIFENSFNQYISLKESQDVVQMTAGAPGVRPTNYGNTSVQNRTLVERAAAIAIKNNIQKVVLNKCRVVGRQDSFFGGTGSRVAVYKGDMMGAVDYIFGGMDVVFYKSNLSMNTSDQSNDAAYITAAQQSTGRGYLMYECTVTTAQPLVETASTYRAKPGYFGRPWQATTSEVVFYNTTIETSNFPGSVGNSLIMPLGWQNTLGGTSSGMYEYGTIEQSGVNNTPSRASWATALTNPILNDGTPITTFNFTKGNDNWDPFPALIAGDQPATCFTSGTQTASTAPTCFGLSDGSSTITMSPVPTNLDATYVLDSGAATPVTLLASGQFTITGLAAGSHTLVVTGSGTCTTAVTVTGISIAQGNQPAMPTLLCYQTASFNNTTCQWDVTGTQPTAGSVTTSAVTSYVWPLPFGTGLTYTASGTYTNTVGCNFATLNLTIIPTVNTFNLGTSCGATISSLAVTIIATPVAGASTYTFRVTNVSTNASFIANRPVNSFALSNYAGITLGTQYQIEVSVNGGTNYGAPCTVFTPAPISTIGSQCGTILTSMTQFVYATYVASVTGYRFRVTNSTTNAVHVYDALSGQNRFSFSQLPASFVSYGTTYSVAVALKNTNGSYLPYGPSCNITTPAFPTSEVVLSQCDYVATSTTQSISAVVISGATGYRFQLVNTSLSYSLSIDRAVNTFNLAMFPGLLSGTTYTVRVAVKIGGVWGPLTGKPCNLTTPGDPGNNEGGVIVRQDVNTSAFNAIAYPNPFAANFMFDLKTTAQSSIQIRVYDMLGKQVENRNVEVSNINSLQVGGAYPSGVYNVIVSQGENTQTLRIVKR